MPTPNASASSSNTPSRYLWRSAYAPWVALGLLLVAGGTLLGRLRLLTLAADLLLILGGTVIAVLALALAMMRERRERLREQEANEAKYRTLVAISSDWVWEMDPEFRFTWVSDRVQEFVGRTPSQLMGRSAVELVPVAHREEVTREFQRQVAESGGFQGLLCPMERAGGRLLWVEASGVPTHDRSGRLLGYRGVCVDVTERVEAAETLRQVLGGAHCVLWRAEVSQDPLMPTGYHWELEITNEEAAREVLPLPLREGQTYRDIWFRIRHREDAREMDLVSSAALREGAPSFTTTFRCLDIHGRMRWMREEVRLTRACDETWHAVGVCTDITPQKLAELDLAQKAATLQSIYDSTPMSMGVVELLESEHDVLHVSCNAVTAALYGLTPSEMVGKRASELGTSPDRIQTWIQRLHQTLRRGESRQFEYERESWHGQPPQWMCMTVTYIGEGETGNFRFAYYIQDLTDHRMYERRLDELNARLEALAYFDPLTGLWNRRSLMERLAEEHFRSVRRGYPLSVMMVDVDHFKSINDTYGHSEGDRVLLRIGELLQAQVRQGDMAGRYGGEEFALILPETPLSAAMAVAERIRTAVEAEDGLPRSVTVSIGLAELCAAESREALLDAADAALYRAKEEGRNRVCAAARSAVPPERMPVAAIDER